MHHRAKFCANRSRRCGDMDVFDFSRWRPSAILDFKKLEILTACTLLWVKMRYRTEFCADRSNHCGDIAVYNFSRWRPSAIGFSKVRNFNCPHPSGGQNESPCLILCRSVKALQRYGRFRFFKMAAVRHLGFVIRPVSYTHLTLPTIYSV